MLLIVIWLGLIISIPLHAVRAGLGKVEPSWREYLIPNLPWFGLVLAKAIAWPGVLAHWITRGCPPAPWQAVTRLPDGRDVRKIVRVQRRAAEAA